MSFCKNFGKDKLIFFSKEDNDEPPKYILPELSNQFEEHGLVLPSGKLNWSCPCVGNMASGPCGYFFREAFECFHTSKAEPKGSDCFEKFADMQVCFNKYPNLYNANDDENDDNNDENDNDDKNFNDLKLDEEKLEK